MNSPFEAVVAGSADAMNLFRVAEKNVSPFEFRMLSSNDMQESAEGDEESDFLIAAQAANGGRLERGGRGNHDAAGREAMLQDATDSARKEGFEEGEREGRRAQRAELDVQVSLQVSRERERVGAAVEQFRGTRDRYFAEVEQQVVKLALAIAARVLHREAQLDPLLLEGVVRVALEKMADRSCVVLRVAGADTEAWERALLAMQPHERPRVAEDARMERGECVLETTMGTVELGVQVQLEEIEKGFFDLLNHRPTA
jgi:flagellar assembly protein FliH